MSQRPPAARRQRRAFSTRALATHSGGDDAACAQRLVTALADGQREDQDQLTHGFHSYPARLAPLLARRLLDDISPGELVLDPFSGSGTVLVEAMRRGARAVGSDVNPLGVALARLKATPRAPEECAALAAVAETISAASLARVKTRARTRSAGDEYDDPERYAPHIFRELVGLREEIDDRAPPPLRMPLLLVLSSIIVKVSRQPADTAAGTVERALAKGFPSRLFAKKADELGRRLFTFSAAVPATTPPPTVVLADARKLAHVKSGSAAVIVTSPPYLGTYDYLEHHARRYGWLDLDPGPFERSEIGARRHAASDADPLARWQADVDAFIGEMARALSNEGRAFIVIGDSVVRRRRVPGDDAVKRAAEKAELRVVAWAHEERPAFFGSDETRREHLLCVEKTKKGKGEKRLRPRKAKSD